MQCVRNGQLTDKIPITLEVGTVCIDPLFGAVTNGPGKPDRADGLFIRATIGPGNAAHRDGDVGKTPFAISSTTGLLTAPCSSSVSFFTPRMDSFAPFE